MQDLVIDALTEAKNVIENKGWTRRASTLNANGRPCAFYDENAARYSLQSALRYGIASLVNQGKTEFEGSDFLCEVAFRYVEWAKGADEVIENLERWNDQPGRTRQDVIDRIQQAIDRRRAIITGMIEAQSKFDVVG